MERTVRTAHQVARAVVENVCTVLDGKRDVIALATTALFARGHLLIEDVPGVGKTTLARALAESVGIGFRRVQFTSDLMPADVIGGSFYEQSTGRFVFRPGPVFTHVMLADEINRTTPKTQSALLEAMEERQVSVEGTTHALEEPFLVIATQNPQDSHGTYPLPESQLDRFLLRIRIGYLSAEAEREVIRQRGRHGGAVPKLNQVVTREDLLKSQVAVDAVRMEESLVGYLHSIVLATRASPMIERGASTRAALALDRAARAFAVVQGRAFVIPDDVKAVAASALAHRVRLRGADGLQAARDEAERVIGDLLGALPVPV